MTGVTSRELLKEVGRKKELFQKEIKDNSIIKDIIDNSGTSYGIPTYVLDDLKFITKFDK